MIDLIKELNDLIVKPKKGSSGYTQLKSSDQVTAHKISQLINKYNQEMMDKLVGGNL